MFIGTMTKTDNRKALEEGFVKAKQIVYEHITSILIKMCDDLIDDALAEKEYGNFTGNTVTSYACGLFISGRLSYVSLSSDKLDGPIRIKLAKGESAYLDPDYDGGARAIKGTVETDGKYGYQTSLDFLNFYNSNSKGFEIVMCTGTEYSSYIEEEIGANVLTDTFINSKQILLSNLKPMN